MVTLGVNDVPNSHKEVFITRGFVQNFLIFTRPVKYKFYLTMTN